jgi:hypothetical protein
MTFLKYPAKKGEARAKKGREWRHTLSPALCGHGAVNWPRKASQALFQRVEKSSWEGAGGGEIKKVDAGACPTGRHADMTSESGDLVYARTHFTYSPLMASYGSR